MVRDHVAKDADFERVALGNLGPVDGFEDHDFVVALSPDDAAGALAAFADVLDGFVGIFLVEACSAGG